MEKINGNNVNKRIIKEVAEDHSDIKMFFKNENKEIEKEQRLMILAWVEKETIRFEKNEIRREKTKIVRFKNYIKGRRNSI
jgi:hypothetical protein